MSLSIGIVGTGALGTLMAWKWREHHLFIRQRTPSPLRIYTHQHHEFSLPEWTNQPLDWLVITTKAADTLTALKSLEENLTRTKRIMLLQNGMGQHDDVAVWLANHWKHIEQPSPQPELWAATSTEGAYRHSDGHVVYAGQGQTFAGLWKRNDPIAPTASSTRINNIDLPLGVIYDPSVNTRLRAKLAINAIINPLTGYLLCANGELISNPEYFTQFESLAKEVSDLFHQLEWHVGFNIPEQALAVANATANNQSSTYQDVINHRPSELPYITGYLLQQAKQHGIKLPITQMLHQTLCRLPVAHAESAP